MNWLSRMVFAHDGLQVRAHPSLEGAQMTSRRPRVSRKPKARSPRRESISRAGLVQSWDASVFVRAESEHGVRERKSMIVLDLHGELQEPVKTVKPFKLTVFAEAEPAPGAGDIPSVGSIISMRGEMDAVVQLAPVEFQLLMAMATSGRLRSVHLSFQEPRYGSALIASFSFSSRDPDGDDV